VIATLGGGHLSPAALERLRAAAARMPIVLAVRPERGAMLASTYGFDGAEGDLRASGAIPAGSLSPQAARMKLLACLGCGLRGEDLALAFSQDDP
jgi:L-asparaginase